MDKDFQSENCVTPYHLASRCQFKIHESASLLLSEELDSFCRSFFSASLLNQQFHKTTKSDNISINYELFFHIPSYKNTLKHNFPHKVCASNLLSWTILKTMPFERSDSGRYYKIVSALLINLSDENSVPLLLRMTTGIAHFCSLFPL